jgi:hypothetical protein
LGVTDRPDESGIRVQTVHSFVGTLFAVLGLDAAPLPQEERHEIMVREMLSLFTQGALNDADVGQLKHDHPDEFAWDYIFIDEGQDWPSAERDLLRQMYPVSGFAIAEGQEQLIRTQSACNWLDGLAKAQRSVVTRTRCLRMKRNLVRFANELAFLLGLPGTFEAEERAVGGRVLVVEGDYFADLELNAELMRSNSAAGNQPIDMLACVPPAFTYLDATGEKWSVAAAKFESIGQSVWDGVNPGIRRSYPLSTQQLRIVQYDSCRGLEGWTVFAFGLDEFYSYKLSEYASLPKVGIALADDPAAPIRYAGRWLMIVLSRAMDTLVLEITTKHSPIRDALKHLAEQFPDFVEWRVAPTTGDHPPHPTSQQPT